MSDTLLKICGITRMQDADIAFSAGADIIGVVRSKRSPRFGSSALIHDLNGRGIPVAGVYTSIEEIGDEIEYLDYVQMHFRHTGDDIDKIHDVYGKKTISVAISTDPELDAKISEYKAFQSEIIMIEFAYGLHSEIKLAKSLLSTHRIGVSGGISTPILPEIRDAGFSLIDVSSSLEISPGVKDAEAMELFIQEAKH